MPPYSGGRSKAVYLMCVLQFGPSSLAMPFRESPLSLRLQSASQHPLKARIPVTEKNKTEVPRGNSDTFQRLEGEEILDVDAEVVEHMKSVCHWLSFGQSRLTAPPFEFNRLGPLSFKGAFDSRCTRLLVESA